MRILLAALSGFALIAAPASAQDARWPPNQAIKFVVPTSAGGGTDLLARVIGERLRGSLGANFVVEDRPGGSCNIGTTIVKNAAPDGTTFLFTQAAHTSNITFFKSRYDPVADFEPVAYIGSISLVVCVNASSPVKSFHDLTELLRVKGDKVTYGSAGYATSSHLAMELFKSTTGLNMTHVPYKGTTPAVTALIAGEVDMAVGTDFSMKQLVESGQMRCLASTGSTRSFVFPEVPTIAEATPLPGYDLESWYGMLGPAKLPRSIIDVMNREVNRFLLDPDFVAKHLASAGITPAPTTPELFRERLEGEVRKYLKLAKDANITPE